MKNALTLSMETGRTIMSDAGDWELSEFGWFPLEGFARWVQPSGQQVNVNFGYKMLGGVFTLGGGIHLEGLNVTGYDRLIIGSESHGNSIPLSSEFFKDGAPPILGKEWIKEVTLKRCNFEATPVVIATGGGWWNYDPESPGIETVFIDDVSVSQHGGVDIRALRWNDIKIKNLQVSGDSTRAALYKFYREFGIDPDSYWENGAGMGTTGMPLSEGYRMAVRVGLQVPADNDMPYLDSNGPCEIENLRVDGFYADIAPLPDRYDQKFDMHGFDLRHGKFKVRNAYGRNILDFSYTDADFANWRQTNMHDPSLDTEFGYGKGVFDIEGLTAINVGPGEAPTFAGKPARAGSRLVRMECRRDESLLPTKWRSRLADYIHTEDTRHGNVITSPGEIPNRTRCGLRPSANCVMDDFKSYGYQPPNSGWEHAIEWWYESTAPKNVQHMDLDGNVLN